MNAAHRFLWMLCVLALAGAAGCAPAATPQLIGAYPQAPGPQAPILPAPASGWSVIDALDVQVWVEDVAYAVGRAQAIVREAGGETLRVRPLDRDDGAELVLVVPVYQAEGVVRRLRAMGGAGGAEPSVRPLVIGPGEALGYTAVTATLRRDPWAAGRVALREGGAWLATVIPPALMVIGAWTVLRAFGQWWARRGTPVAGDRRAD